MKRDLNLEELEWSDADFNVDEETVVRSTVETLQVGQVDSVDIDATKVIPTSEIAEHISSESTDEVQELIHIIDTQYSETKVMPELPKADYNAADTVSVEEPEADLEMTRVIPTLTEAPTEQNAVESVEEEAVFEKREIILTEEEEEELGDLTYHDEDVRPIRKSGASPKKHPEHGERAQRDKNHKAKSSVKTGDGRNIKVQHKKKNAFEKFILNLSWMDALIGLTGVLAAAILIFVVVFWTNNNNKVTDLGEFSSIGMKLSELDAIGNNGINRIVTTGGDDVVGEVVVAPEEGEEEANPIMVSVSFTSIEKDLKIKFINKENDKLIDGVPFELEVVTPSNETLIWIDDDEDGMIYRDGLKGGAYMVTIKSVDSFKFPADATKVMVKDKISYQVINVLDEIKTEDEINVAVEDTEDKDNIDQEALLEDTIKWVPSEKKVSAGADGYALIEKKDITDPMTLTEAVAGGFRKVSAPSGTTSELTSQSPSEITSEPTSQKPSETPSEPTSQKPSETPSEPTSQKPSETPSEPTSQKPSETPSEPTSQKPSETPSEPTSQKPSESPSEPTSQKPSEKPSEITPYVTGITMDKASVEVKIGSTASLKAAVAGTSGCDTKVTWAVADAKIATVKDGVITPVAVGETTVTATTVGKDKTGKAMTATCKVVVKPAGELSLKVNATTGQILVGEKFTIVPTVENFQKDKTVSYSVDKKEIATVDANGVVTGVAKGTAVITVTTNEKGSDGNAKTTTVTITVKADPKKDTVTLLKDATGAQVYIKNAEGKYVQAKWADYYTAAEFYVESEPIYDYYGWQTLEGKTYYFDENGKKVTGEQVISGVKYNFASDGSLSMNGGVLGIDVSKWNGTIDWNAVKESGISFVIIRCGYRGSKTGVLVQDPKFESYITGANKAGLKVGLYFFSQAVNEKEAVEEASMAIALAQKYKISYPIFIDTEWTSGGRANSISKETRTAVCKAFCETIKSAGYTPGVYACKSWYQDSLNVSSLSGYKIWLAQYASQPTYSNRYDMWQYTDKGKVNGISTNVDMNISYLGY